MADGLPFSFPDSPPAECSPALRAYLLELGNFLAALARQHRRITQQQPALTAKDATSIDSTYDSDEQGVIENNRTRIEEIETLLRTLGILP